jgi:hypothetical protein
MTESEKMQEEVYDYLDGLLSDQNRKMIEQKLASEPSYRSFLEDAKVLRRNLKHLPRLRTSEDFDTILRARIKIEKSLSRRRGFRYLPRFMPAYVTAAALLALAMFLLPSFDQQPTQPSFTVDQQATPLFEPPSGPEVRSASSPTVNFPTDVIRTGSSNATGLPVRKSNRALSQFLTDSTAAQKTFAAPEGQQQIRTVRQVQEF